MARPLRIEFAGALYYVTSREAGSHPTVWSTGGIRNILAGEA